MLIFLVPVSDILGASMKLFGKVKFNSEFALISIVDGFALATGAREH